MSGLRRRLAGAVLAVVATLSPVAAALPAAAAAAPAGSAVTVAITAITPAVLTPGQDLSVTATLNNAGSSALNGVVANLRLNRFRPASRAEIDSWVTGSGGAVGSWVAAAGPVAIPAGGSVTVQLLLPAAKVGLGPGSWGPRGLAVEAVTANGTRLGIQRTFALWQRDEVIPQVRVAVLAPVTGATMNTAALEQATGPGGRLRALADVATSDADVGLAVDPALVAAAAAGGTNAAAWASNLTSVLARRDAFALPWGDTDLAAVAHAGRPELLRAAVSLSAASGSSGLEARTDLMWAPDGTLDQQTVDTAAAAGAKAIVVGTGTLQASAGVGTAMVTINAGGTTLPGLVPDKLLTDLLVAPDTVEPGSTTATAVQRMLAELAVLAHDGSARSHDVLLAPGRDWTPDPSLVAALLAALRTSPWTRLVPVSAVLGGVDEGTERSTLPANATDQGELSVGRVRALADARDGVTAFAHSIGDGGTLTNGLDQKVLRPLSVAWRGDQAARDALVTTVLSDATAARTGLSLTTPPGLNVISSTAPVRFVVRNDLSVPAKVAVSVRPRKACLRPATSDTITAAPGSQTSVVVNLAAVANCDVTVDATLVGADGHAVAPRVQFDARVAPTIEDVGTIVVAALLALGLVLGIARTVRRGRSARRGARRAPEDEPPLPLLGGEVPTATSDENEDLVADDAPAPAPTADDAAGAS